MQEYSVQWTIEIDASSSEEAARKALAIQRDPFSSSTVFKVLDETGEEHSVDLEEVGT